MLNKLYILIFFFIIGIGSYLAYPIIKERYIEVPENEDSTSNKHQEIKVIPESPESETDSEAVIQTPVPEFDQDVKNSFDGKSFIEVSREDCENECASFAENLPNFNYCQQVCGLSSSPATHKENCEGLDVLDKDYCLKDLAIEKSDFSLCDKIKDENLNITCISNITEQLLKLDRESIE